MSEPNEQAPQNSSIGGAVLEIAVFSLIIGAVLYTVVWRGDMPLRLVVTAHIVMTLVVAIAVIVVGEKLFETLIVVVILTVMTWLGLPAYYEHSVRSSVREAVGVGDAVAQALDRSPARKPVDQLGVAIPPDKVAVAVAPDGSFTLTLAEPPLAGKQVSFAPTVSKGARTWRCSSKQIEQRYLPQRCRD
jgi:hypothetical protein